MEQNKEEYYSITDIFSHLKSFLHYLRRMAWLIILGAIIGAAVGILYYTIQKPKYEAVTTFILEEKSAGGGLAGIASQFGFDLGSLSGGGGSIFTGDNILDILSSKKIVRGVLLTKIDSIQSSLTLGDLFLEFNGWKKKWSSDNELKSISYDKLKEETSLNGKQDSVLNEIYEFLLKNSLSIERLNKKGSIIKVQITATNNVFAKLMTERLVDAAAKLYLDIKTGTAQANIEKLQRRSDSLLLLLNRKSYTAALSQPLDINPGIKAAIVPVEIATRDKTVLATLYAEVTKNLEVSKLILSQQTPVIQMLDRPGLTLENNKKSLAYLMITCSFTAGFLFLIIAFILFQINRLSIRL